MRVAVRVLAMLHLYTPHHNAGAETTAHQLLKRLVDRGHQVTVQLSQTHPMFVTGPYNYEGVNVWPRHDKEDPLRWINSDHPPDLIVSHLENVLRASILGDMNKIPTAVMMHNGHGKSKADLRWGASLIVYNTDWMRADVEAWWKVSQGTSPPRGIVVRPAIFADRYRVKPPSARDGCVTLINLFEEKGPHVLYALAERFPQQKFLGVCGAYGQQVVRHDLPNVEILPHVAANEMPSAVYARTRILLMPSSQESYGRASVEAACSGIPTIAHPTTGLLEALGDGGTFCDRDDVEAWSIELQRLLNPKAWATASARAKRVADRLTPDADLDRWAETVEQTVTRYRQMAAAR